MGLTIYNLRTAARMDEGRAERYRALCGRQESVFKNTPRTSEGWLQINRFQPEEKKTEYGWARDEYAFPTEYSVASACYLLLSRPIPEQTEARTVAPTKPTSKPHADPAVGAAYSNDLGLARMENHDGEAIVRTRSQPLAMNRRYLGPTVLHYARSDRILVGTIPILCTEDFSLKHQATGRIQKLFQLFAHRFSLGIESLNALFAGFVPVITEGGYLHFPVELEEVRTESSAGVQRMISHHRMRKFLWRGLRVAVRDTAGLVAKNLFPRPGKRHEIRQGESPFRMTREVRLSSRSLDLQDIVEGPLEGRRLRIGVRYFPEARVSVEGLTLDRQINGWSSDGLSCLDLYNARCEGELKTYTIVIK
jgi:hypothetical protein